MITSFGEAVWGSMKNILMKDYLQSETELLGSARWFVMTSPDPKYVEEELLDENLRRKERGVVPFRFFVPYAFLKRRIAESCDSDDDISEESSYFNPRAREAVVSNNELRSALRRYIFIKSSPLDLDNLLHDRMHHDVYRSLWYYRDRSGRKVTVGDVVMSDFIRACCDKRFRFEVWPALEGIEANDEVMLNSTPFKGYRARVLEVRHGKNGCTLTVGFHLLHGGMLLKLPDLRPEDVLYERKDSEAIVRETNRYKMLEDIQRKLFMIMNHRLEVELSEKKKKKDFSTLSFLYNYRYHLFESDAMRRKLSGLMLLCATLLGDASGKSELVSAVLCELRVMDAQPAGKVARDVHSLLHSCLYLATRDAYHFEEAMSYFRSHSHPSATHKQWMKYLMAPACF